MDYIIWDFNGTILDDIKAGIDSVNKLLRDRGLKEISGVDEYRRVFRFPIKGYYERIGFDFNKEPYEVIAPLWVEEYLINVKSATLFCDVIETLEYFKEKGVKQVILSATERNMLLGQLSELGISGYFEEIMGLDNIHAHSKEGLAKDWRMRHTDSAALLIGDTDHDFFVAASIGADCALVSRGHQSKEYLRSLGVPTFDNLVQLRDALFD